MLIDTHSHLDQDDFDNDRDEVIARAVAAGVTHIVSLGVTADSSAAIVALTDRYPPLYAAVGVHPNYTAGAVPADWDRIIALVGRNKVVALGETGLDKYRNDSPLSVQQEWFARHLELSRCSGLPFVVHTRSSEAEVLDMLRDAARAKAAPLHGIMHSFTGDESMAAECVELGMHISFAGMLTYKKSDDLRKVAATIPLDRLLVETDSPYLAPQPMRGKRNEPANVVHTAQCLADVRGMTLAALAAQTTANARALFSLGG